MPSQFEVFTECPKTGEFVNTGATVTKPVFDGDVHAGGTFNCTPCNGSHSWSSDDEDVEIHEVHR